MIVYPSPLTPSADAPLKRNFLSVTAKKEFPISNIASNPEKESFLKQHRAQLPKSYPPLLGKGSIGHQSYSATEEKCAE